MKPQSDSREASSNTIRAGTIRVRRVHSLAIRWMHWLNFPLLTIMIVSGMFIYWAYDVYTPFVPDSFYRAIRMDHKLAYGMALHFFFMWFFALNGLLFVLYLFISGEWREIWPRPKHFREALLVTLSDFGFRVNRPGQGKFNAAQRVAYTGVIVMAGFSILTGLAIYRPIQLPWLRNLFLNYSVARLTHFLLAIGFILFFIVHIIQVIRDGWNKFRAMIVGDEVVADEEK